MNSKAPHLESIDVARGLAALSVAICHQRYGSGLAHVSGVSAFLAIDWPGSYLAVPLFFVISGFCIHLGGLARQDDPHFTRTFFILRFFRIYPPWVSAVLLSALATTFAGREVTGTQLITHLTLTNGFFDDYRLNPVLWSVSVESCLYLLYPLWLAFRRRHGLAAAFALGLAVSTASGAITARIQPVPSGPAMWFFINVWCGWLAGAVFAELWQRHGRTLLRHPAWWLTGAAAGLLHLAALQTGFYRGTAVYALLPATIILCSWLLALLMLAGDRFATLRADSAPVHLWRAFAGIGFFSYSLYLLHVPLQSLVYHLLPFLSSQATKALLLVAWLGVVLLGSWLHFRWIEIPSINWGRRIAARWRSSSPSALPT
jgi:peptidoglycan/LPS O-acetylase OafA/YrhL